jgi:hypothetical protein
MRMIVHVGLLATREVPEGRQTGHPVREGWSATCRLSPPRGGVADAPLTPPSFLLRSADVCAGRPAVADGERTLTYAEHPRPRA